MFGKNADPKWALDTLRDDILAEQELKRRHEAIVKASRQIADTGSWRKAVDLPPTLPSRLPRHVTLRGTAFVAADGQDSVALREYVTPDNFRRFGLFAQRGEEEPVLVAEFAGEDTIKLTDVGTPDGPQSNALEDLLDTLEASPDK